jgi:hypothetical protein
VGDVSSCFEQELGEQFNCGRFFDSVERGELRP